MQQCAWIISFKSFASLGKTKAKDYTVTPQVKKVVPAQSAKSAPQAKALFSLSWIHLSSIAAKQAC